MTPPTKTWKNAEAIISRYFPNGKRRGADFRNRDRAGGKNDVLTTGYSVEIKHGKKVTWSLITGAVAQAQAAKEHPDDIPLAVIHKEGTQYGQSIVAMTLDDFAAHFVSQPE